MVTLEKWRNLTPPEVERARHALGEFAAMFFCEEEDADDEEEPLPELNLISVVCESNKEADIAALSERLLCNEKLLQRIRPDNTKVKFRTQVYAGTTVVLQPYSCAAGGIHSAIVGYFYNRAWTWCETHASDWATATSDHAQTLGMLGAAPDVTIIPCRGIATSQYPRFIIEVEVSHRSITELRQQVFQYFQQDANNDLCGVLVVFVTNTVNHLRASAVLWTRDPVTHAVTVAQTFDFGPDEIHPTQLVAWSAVGHNLAPPVVTITRYNPQTPAWPDAGAVANWYPAAPIMTIPSATIVHNYDPRIVFGALDDLELDLGRALEMGARI